MESGFEDGVFTFYQNGKAEYVIGNNTLSGSWSLSDASDGYFAADGNYYNDDYHKFSIYITNYTGTETIDMTVDVGSWSDPFTGSIYGNDYVDYFEFTSK